MARRRLRMIAAGGRKGTRPLFHLTGTVRAWYNIEVRKPLGGERRGTDQKESGTHTDLCRGTGQVDDGGRAGRRCRRFGGLAVPFGRQLRHRCPRGPSVGAVFAAGGRFGDRVSLPHHEDGGQGHQRRDRVGAFRQGSAHLAGAADLYRHGHHPFVRRQRRS